MWHFRINYIPFLFSRSVHQAISPVIAFLSVFARNFNCTCPSSMYCNTSCWFTLKLTVPGLLKSCVNTRPCYLVNGHAPTQLFPPMTMWCCSTDNFPLLPRASVLVLLPGVSCRSRCTMPTAKSCRSEFNSECCRPMTHSLVCFRWHIYCPNIICGGI
jgi:hypothetical protein